MTTPQKSFAELLESALTNPGTISASYSAFHNYSFGNQLLAMAQCMAREIPIGPIATFPKWKELGRFVRKGEKAIVLCQPVTIKSKDAAEGETPEVFTRFMYRANWFVMAQTIAINPVGMHPFRTTLHEIAHIVLGHTSEGTQMSDDATTPRTIREVEAESVAFLCAAALGFMDGADDSRGYIQTWHARGEAITDKHAQRIFKATDTILKAGQVDISTDVDRDFTTEG